MREIKFRAWNVHLGFMEHDVHLLDSLNERLNDERHHVMQYAGIKDKNGVEIYEGDICLWVRRADRCECGVFIDSDEKFCSACGAYTKDKVDKATCSVVFEKGSWKYHWPDAEEDEVTRYWLRDMHPTYGAMDETTVIGNIHQNPELLK